MLCLVCDIPRTHHHDSQLQYSLRGEVRADAGGCQGHRGRGDNLPGDKHPDDDGHHHIRHYMLQDKPAAMGADNNPGPICLTCYKRLPGVTHTRDA